MKTILVPTDFSEHALYALKVAAILAKKIKARIKLVHVFNLPSRGVSDVSYYQSFFNEIKADAEHKLKELAHFISRSLAESLVRHESKPILSIKIHTPQELAVTKLGQPYNYENWGKE